MLFQLFFWLTFIPLTALAVWVAREIVEEYWVGEEDAEAQ